MHKTAKTLVRLSPPDPLPTLQKLREFVTVPEAGAVVSFVGTVRNNNNNKQVTHLVYESYPELLHKTSRSIINSLRNRSTETKLINVACAFRLGKVRVGQASTFIVVATPHRKTAFTTCSELLDSFKQELPIWKKEFYADGSSWIVNS